MFEDEGFGLGHESPGLLSMVSLVLSLLIRCVVWLQLPRGEWD